MKHRHEMWVGLIIVKETDFIEALKTTGGDDGIKTFHQWQFVAQTVKYIS